MLKHDMPPKGRKVTPGVWARIPLAEGGKVKAHPRTREDLFQKDFMPRQPVGSSPTGCRVGPYKAYPTGLLVLGWGESVKHVHRPRFPITLTSLTRDKIQIDLSSPILWKVVVIPIKIPSRESHGLTPTKHRRRSSTRISIVSQSSGSHRPASSGQSRPSPDLPLPAI